MQVSHVTYTPVSTLIFRMHYDGKLHDKRSRLFLNQWSKENQQPAPQKKVPDGPTAAKVAKTIAKETKEQLQADDLYCNVCDLSFTSQVERVVRVPRTHHISMSPRQRSCFRYTPSSITWAGTTRGRPQGWTRSSRGTSTGRRASGRGSRPARRKSGRPPTS